MKRSLILLATIATLGLAIAYQTGSKLSLDGANISSRCIVQNGQLYVPAADVAKALGKNYTYNAATKSGVISDGGGVMQADGTSGAPGEWLANGKTRLKMDAGFTEQDGKKVLSFEVRNAEKKRKGYNFGFNVTDFILYDEAGNSKEGDLLTRDAYSADIAPAAMQRVKFGFRFDDDFKPVRLVISLQTQISGNPPKIETFRIKL